MSGYEKHNIYVGKYADGGISKHGVISLPDARLVVRFFVGEDDQAGHFAVPIEGDHPVLDERSGQKVCLILEDGSFWPVMSFLTVEEAHRLGHLLLEAR